MIEVALGAILGLGLFVLVSGSGQSSLVRRVEPFIRDRSPLTVRTEASDSAVSVLRAVARFPLGVATSTFGRRAAAEVSDELVGVLDLIGLCLAAGISVPAALERVGAVGEGVIAAECRAITAEISLGVSVTDALHASDRRVRHDGWSRLIEHLISSRRQGTPLVDIVRSLSDDEHLSAGRRLLESASTKETLMMFPLVFVILPVTVIMAIFPGISALGSLTL